MKSLLLLLCLSSFLLSAQQENVSKPLNYGFSLYTGWLGEVESVWFGPSVFVEKNNHQFELGTGYHPFVRNYQHKFTGEFMYKFFSKGVDQPISFYPLACISVTRNDHFKSIASGDFARKETYAACMFGLGMQVKLFDKAYLGLNVSTGISTVGSRSNSGKYTYNMFKHYDFEKGVRFHIGYRL